MLTRNGGWPARVNTVAPQAPPLGALRALTQIDAELVRDVADDHE